MYHYGVSSSEPARLLATARLPTPAQHPPSGAAPPGVPRRGALRTAEHNWREKGSTNPTAACEGGV